MLKSFVRTKKLLPPALAVLVLLFSIFVYGEISAQTLADFSVKLSPKIPGPNQTVIVKLVSYSFDLNRATITWSLNGETLLSGVGKKEFSFKTEGVGESSRLLIRTVGEAGRVEEAVVVTPGDVDLLWQVSDGYTPPFYRGKTLASPGSLIKIVAMPNLQKNGEKLSFGSLVYNWSKNYKPLPSESGYGKNYLVFRNDYLDSEENIKLEVTSVDGSAGTEGSLSVNISDPVVLFYENMPLRGVVYENAISGIFNMRNEEVRLSAEPYFFSAGQKQNQNLIYKWNLNGKNVLGSPDDLSSLVLRSGDGSGTSRVSLSVSNSRKIMQGGGRSLLVNFGKK